MIDHTKDDEGVTVVVTLDTPVFAAIERVAADLVLRPAELARRVLSLAFAGIEEVPA